MFCAPNQWRAAKFPRDKFYDSKSKAGGVLMHSKVRCLVRASSMGTKSSNFSDDYCFTAYGEHAWWQRKE